VFRRVRRHLSYANVVATAALFLALGGVSYAAVALPANSVGTKQLRRGAVTTRKVENRTLLAVDFQRGQLPRGARGAVGAQGPQGAQGLQGAPALPGTPGSRGAPGISGLEQVISPNIPVGAGARVASTVRCPGQKTVISGGVFTLDGATKAINASAPDGTTGWVGAVNNTGTLASGFFVYAICATVAP
jgi:hypothetical protein